MAIYNLTFLDNATSVPQMVDGLNNMLSATVGEYAYARFALIGFFLIYQIVFHKDGLNEVSEVMITGSFLTTILALMFIGLEWIPSTDLFYPLIILVSTTIIHFIKNKQ